MFHEPAIPGVSRFGMAVNQVCFRDWDLNRRPDGLR